MISRELRSRIVQQIEQGRKYRDLVKFQDGRIISLPPTRHILIQAGYNIVEQDASSLWIKDSVLITGEVPKD